MLRLQKFQTTNIPLSQCQSKMYQTSKILKYPHPTPPLEVSFSYGFLERTSLKYFCKLVPVYKEEVPGTVPECVHLQACRLRRNRSIIYIVTVTI